MKAGPSGAGGGRPDQPLVEPRVSPPTNCFWSTKYTMSVGRATSTAPAATRLLSTKNWPLRLFSADVIGQLVAGGHQDQRPEEVVVDEGDLSVARAARAGCVRGRMTFSTSSRHRRAVDDRRLVQLVRQGLHVVAQHERAEAELECDVDDHDPDVLVVEEAVVTRGSVGSGRSRYIRNSGVMMTCGGQQVQRREQHQQREVEAPAVARHGERHHRGQEQDEDDRRDDDDRRVFRKYSRQLGPWSTAST